MPFMTLLKAGKPPAGAAPGAAYWNPADKTAAITLSNANKTAANSSGNFNYVRSVTSHASGKYAYKFTFTDNFLNIGCANSTKNLTTTLIGDANGFGYVPLSGSLGSGFINDAAGSNAYGIGMDAGDIGIIAVDITGGKGYVSRNGTWMNSADPVAGTGGFTMSVSGALFILGMPDILSIGGLLTIETDGAAFTPPTGYTAWG